MAGSSDSEDRGRRRSIADLYGDDPEEREYRFDEEAEDSYNIHGDATSDSSARANNGDARAKQLSSSVAASRNGDGSAYPATVDPVLADLYGDELEERAYKLYNNYYRSHEEAEDYHGDATGNSAGANNGDARDGPPSSSVAASENGNWSPYPAVDPMLGCDSYGEEFRSREAVCDNTKVHQEAEQGIGKVNCGAKRDVAVLSSYWGVARKREWPGAVGDENGLRDWGE